MADGIDKTPEGYGLFPLGAEQESASMRLALLVRRQPDASGGRFVILRRTLDAVAMLGVLIDRSDRIHRRLEIRIQQIGAIRGTPSSRRQTVSNAVLDARWIQQVRALEKLEDDGLVATGWETEHPLPLFMDPESLKPIEPLHEESGHPWRLCEDDALLLRAGLSPYRSGPFRYWHVPELGGQSPFVPLTADTPRTDACWTLEQALGREAGVIAVNPEGGLLLVRSFSPIGLDDYIDAVGGRAWEGWRHGRSPLPLDAAAESLRETAAPEETANRFFLFRHGPASRFLETYCLKLNLLADVVSTVRHYVERTREPLLNVNADGFSIDFPRGRFAIPILWRARLRLAEAGNALSIPLPNSDARFRIMLEGQGPSIFWAALLSRKTRGQGLVRIRSVQTDARGQTTVEGTFETRESIDPGRRDLVWLRLPGAERPFDLYARIENASSLAVGEWRFRSSDQAWSKGEAEALKAMEGVVCREVDFELLPQLSSPCDLYAIGVLAARVFFQNERNPLPVALDRVLSLARQVAARHDPKIPLPERLEGIYREDPRWAEALGPHQLLYTPAGVEEGRDWMPAELWRDTLCMLVQTFPGFGPDSRCRDFGDAPEEAPHQVFDRIETQLDSLITRTRALLFGDTRRNLEIHELIQPFKR